ncbi:GNAT family N-acetyltransferase [Bacillus massilinigeriensis]|uniref:GNAT family N-acetyltransferase n=1 Tax=Bacillus massilionigeriensis TaxID=1805475 RepID=UPI00096B5BD6|nr:GNAT family N-acetyltransferase [Bacillus massilionigeriensis]
MYEVISYQEKEKWEEKLNLLKRRDVFYHQAYSNVCQGLGDGDPYLFFYEDRKYGGKLCYVFIKRRIELFSGSSNDRCTTVYYDITTPSYGYGGPLYDEKDDKLLFGFRSAFEEYCKKENIVCEFIKFHPLLQNQHHLENTMEVSFDRETVYIDLCKNEEEIVNSYHKNHKRNMKKAKNNKLEFTVFQGKEAFNQITTFYRLYKETMDKLQASKYSYFSTDYLFQLLEGFQNHFLIGAVYQEGDMISAALCLHDGGRLHYHLGCSNKDFLNLGGNPYLFHRLALWGKENGLKAFHLGGGHSALHNGGVQNRDSLFQFKYRFNPDGLLDFYIGKKIHIPEVYKNLVNQWETYYGQKADKRFFPLYRNQPKIFQEIM